jgi:hypothetical protein
MGGAALAVFGVGLPRTDLVLLVLGGAALALGAASILLTWVVAAGLWIALRRRGPSGDPLVLECGAPARTGFWLPALSAVPLAELAWSWESPEASVEIERRSGRLFETARARRRRHDTVIVRRVEVSDAFHLTKVAFLTREARPVRALPSAGALRRMSLARSAATGSDLPMPFERPEGERVDMRLYAPGDPMRLILWKTFARTRQAVVRSPEQAVSPAQRTAAYVIAGEGDEAAAGIARAAVESGALGAKWVLGADGAPDAAKSREEAMDVLMMSGRADPSQGGEGLAAFLKRHAADPSTRVVLFTPPSPGPWLDRTAAALKSRGSGRGGAAQSGKGVDALVCIDGMTRKTAARRLARLLFLPETPGERERGARHAATATTPSPADVAKVLKALTTAGAGVTLADRRAGRTYTGPAQRALFASASTGMKATEGAA